MYYLQGVNRQEEVFLFYFTMLIFSGCFETGYLQRFVGSDSWIPDGNLWEVYSSFPWLRILLWEWSQLSDYLIRPGVRSEATVCSAVSKHFCSLCLFVPIRGLTDCRHVIWSPAHLTSMFSASNIEFVLIFSDWITVDVLSFLLCSVWLIIDYDIFFSFFVYVLFICR